MKNLAPILILAATVGTPAASAQDLPQVSVTINALGRAALHGFAESQAFRELTADEDTIFAATYAAPHGLEFDVGGAVRIGDRLGIGVSVSYFDRGNTGAYDLVVPHPLFLESPRTVAGTVDDLQHRELGLHVLALYTLPTDGRLRVNLQGGPSVFFARQTIVQGLTIDEVPPYDSVVLQDVGQRAYDLTRPGFNIGLDATWMVSPRVGLGTLVRYSWANGRLTPPGTVVQDRTIEMDLGGVQLGGGLRLAF